MPKFIAGSDDRLPATVQEAIAGRRSNRKIENMEEGLIRVVYATDLLKLAAQRFDPLAATAKKTSGISYLRVITLEARADSRVRNGTFLYQLTVLVTLIDYAVNAVGFGVETIKAQLKTDILQQQDAGRHTGGKTKEVNEGVARALAGIPEGDFQVLDKHKSGDFCLSIAQKTRYVSL